MGAVPDALAADEAPFVFVDQRCVLAYRIDGELLRLPDRTVDLRQVSAAYLRPYDSDRLPALARAGSRDVALQHAVRFDTALWSWAETTTALVVNRASAMAHNGSKPFQASHAASFGFPAPDTLRQRTPTQSSPSGPNTGTSCTSRLAR